MLSARTFTLPANRNRVQMHPSVPGADPAAETNWSLLPPDWLGHVVTGESVFAAACICHIYLSQCRRADRQFKTLPYFPPLKSTPYKGFSAHQPTLPCKSPIHSKFFPNFPLKSIICALFKNHCQFLNFVFSVLPNPKHDTREQLRQEVEQLPALLVREVLDFLLFVRNWHASQWPPGLRNQTAGAWQGEPLVRVTPEEMEQRLVLE